MIWAFNKANSSEKRNQLVESLKDGFSRFGWPQLDEHNLSLENNWSENHPKQQFLLQIKPNDWIVHINTPEYGECVAVKVIGTYLFDGGIQTEDGVDFRHAIPVDPKTVTIFKRNNNRIVPTVNLTPRSRYQRIYAEKDFLESINRINNDESIGDYHIKGGKPPAFKSE